MAKSKRKSSAHKRDGRIKIDWRKSMGLHPDFPLLIQGDREQPNRLRWAKKVRGKLHYFGKVADDPKGEAALTKWTEQKDDLIAGREPRATTGGLALRELCSKFLESKRADVALGKLSSRTFVEYHRTTDLLIDHFGRGRAVEDIRPADFEGLYFKLAKKHGLTTLGREVNTIRSVFKYGVESDLIKHVVKYGPRFKAPSKADRRKHRAKRKREHGAKLFTAADVNAMLAKALPQLKAMIYLGVNCGFGNSDCATLPLTALDLKSGWIDFPRPKTGIERRIPLWPETVKALQSVIDARGSIRNPRDPADAKLVFLTRTGQPWVRYVLDETKGETSIEVKGRATDSIACETDKLLKSLGIKRPGLSFYTLRHTFETVAGGTADQVAVDAVMGHVDASMAAEYREEIEDSRLQAVVGHVRTWLNSQPAKASDEGNGPQSPALPVAGEAVADGGERVPLRIVG